MEKGKENVRVIQTARYTGDRLTEQAPVVWTPDADEAENKLFNLYPDVQYQEIEGFGGAFTEAGAVTLAKLSPSRRREIIAAYFDPVRGHGYSLCRTHINSCDFSLGNYTYVREQDERLESFDIARDREALIPFIRSAMETEGASFRLLATPWSPPGWMKTSGRMNGGGKLLPQYRDAWARYFIKYIHAYGEAGVPIWGVSVQNEAKAVQTWDSCVFSAEEEKDFVKQHLGPALAEAGLADTRILIWDHNKERVYERSKAAFEDPEASRYIWGAGFHWYSGDHFGGLDAVHQRFPDKKLIFTEGCVENGVKLGSWTSGERYGHHMIGDLNHWCSGWMDWNMLLDETGGPNHVGNYCDAPIIADWKNDKIYYQSSYYYIGHFSKYIRPGARRIGHSVYSDALECAAFQNPDGGLIAVVLNRTDSAVPYTLRLKGELAHLQSAAHSIQTLILKEW